MQPRDPQRTVRQSVLDRLMEDDAEAGRAGTPWSRSVARLKASLRRDVEWLLNTRRTIEPLPEGAAELARSVHQFGLTDLSSLSADSGTSRRRLLREVEEAVALFEPRLSRVRVSPVESEGHEVRFVVEGVLQVEPEPEREACDTVLETASGPFRVSGGGDA